MPRSKRNIFSKLSDQAKLFMERIGFLEPQDKKIHKKQQAKIKKLSTQILAHIVGTAVGVASFVTSPTFLIGAGVGLAIALTAIFAPPVAILLFGSAFVGGFSAAIGFAASLMIGGGVVAALASTVIKAITKNLLPKPEKTGLEKAKAAVIGLRNTFIETIEPAAVFTGSKASPLTQAIFVGTCATDAFMEKNGYSAIWQDSELGEAAIDIMHLANGSCKGMFKK